MAFGGKAENGMTGNNDYKYSFYNALMCEPTIKGVGEIGYDQADVDLGAKKKTEEEEMYFILQKQTWQYKFADETTSALEDRIDTLVRCDDEEHKDHNTCPFEGEEKEDEKKKDKLYS